MNRADLVKILESQPPREALPDSKAMEAVQSLLAHPGLPYLYSLMLGSRQAAYAMLANAQLTNMQTVASAAVLQGTIKGIELFGSTLLEQSVPSPDEKEQ